MRTVRQLMDLAGRGALVVGGAGHIGTAVADALMELGAGIAIVDFDPQACRDVAARLSKRYGLPAYGFPTDITDEAQCAEAVEQATRELGRLDVLVFSAALVGTTPLAGWIGPLETQSAATWRRALDVNLTAAFTLTRTAAPYLAEHGYGSIVAISSIYGLVGPDLRLYDDTTMGNPAAYAASKGGLQAFARWSATALSPRIRVNVVSPGGILRGQDEQFIARYEQRTPLQRLGSEEDLIGAVAYLASDLSAYVTGQNIVVDGGYTAW